MPQFWPNAGADWLATLVQTELAATSKIRLWRAEEITPSIATTRAQLLAAEATYTGYTAGGLVLGAWFDPLANPLGGFSIDSAKVQFAPAAPFTVENNIGGFWIETAAADLIMIASFAAPIPMGAAGNGFPVSSSLIFPN